MGAPESHSAEPGHPRFLRLTGVPGLGIFVYGEMSEWFKEAVLKTVERKLRGFESLPVRH